MHILSSCVI